MEISIVKLDSCRIPRKFLTLWAETLIDVLKKNKNTKNKDRLKAQELSIVFLSPKKIQKINHEFRGKNKITDVISFEGDSFLSFGELLFCYRVIEEKAHANGCPYRLYLCFLLTHGVLHLLGYEHEKSKKAEKEMFSFQNEVFEKVAAKLAPRFKNDFYVVS